MELLRIFYELYRVELTLFTVLVGGVVLGFVIQALWPRKPPKPKKVRASKKSQKKSDEGEDGVLKDAKWHKDNKKVEKTDEYRDINLYGEPEEADDADVYKDWH